MYILNIREGGGGGGGLPTSPTLDPRLQYWLVGGYIHVRILGNICVLLGRWLGRGTGGGGLEIENGIVEQLGKEVCNIW